MTQAMVFAPKTADDVISLLLEIKRDVAVLKEKVETMSLSYGTEKWWEESTKRALKEVEMGEFYCAKDINDTISYLHS